MSLPRQKMAAKACCLIKLDAPYTAPLSFDFKKNMLYSYTYQLPCSTFRACCSIEHPNKAYNKLGIFSLKQKIEDAVLRAEVMAATALKDEQARWIKQEEMIRDSDLWDDPVKSSEILVELADSLRSVDALKDLTYKVEEAKLITQLAEMNAINCGLFEQAYTASMDVSKFLEWYEMLKLLRGTYDMHGASVVIQAGSVGIHHELWAEELLNMYAKWAERQGYIGRVVEKCPSKSGGMSSVTIEFEFDYAFGYLQGEKGIHRLMQSSESGSTSNEVSIAAVDVIPLFFRGSPDLQINEEDLIISSPSSTSEEQAASLTRVSIEHVPTGISVQSSGERSWFGNKIKAMNRLKARLLVIAGEQEVTELSSIKKDALSDIWQIETRTYISHPYKVLKDVKTGMQLCDLNSVMDGNIEPLIGAHINMRQTSLTV